MRKLTRSHVDAAVLIDADAAKAAHEIDEAMITLNNAIDAYNAFINRAVERRDEIVSDMEAFADDRSDAWRDGDRGQAYDSWKNEFETFELETVENFDLPEFMGALCDLPTSAEG